MRQSYWRCSRSRRKANGCLACRWNWRGHWEWSSVGLSKTSLLESNWSKSTSFCVLKTNSALKIDKKTEEAFDKALAFKYLHKTLQMSDEYNGYKTSVIAVSNIMYYFILFSEEWKEKDVAMACFTIQDRMTFFRGEIPLVCIEKGARATLISLRDIFSQDSLWSK